MDGQGLSLRYYVALLMRAWKVLALWIVVACISAAAVTYMLPRSYTSEATVAVLRTRTEVEFDPRITTLTDYELARSDLESRRNAMSALVLSNFVVTQVLDDVGDYLEPAQRNIVALRGMVEISTTGDLININVRHRDAETATAIANSWAENYERYINSIYVGALQLAGDSTVQQVEVAYRAYETAQKELESFISENRAAALGREITARVTLLEGYRQAQVEIRANPVTSQSELLADYYAELRNIENALADATALLAQVQSDSDAPATNLGNLVALVQLRSRVFGEIVTPNEGSPISLQLDLGNTVAEPVSPREVQSVIQILGERRESAEERIAELENQLLDVGLEDSRASSEAQLSAEVEAVEEEIRRLQRESEAQAAQQRQLELKRDQAWETYSALNVKQAEEEVSITSSDAEVRIADRAVVPSEPAGRGLIRNVILAGLLAGMVGVTAVVALDWWRAGEPPIGEETRTEDRAGSEPDSAPDMTPATGQSA